VVVEFCELEVRVEELLDEGAERVGVAEGLELVAELEVADDVLDVGGEPVEPVLKVGAELLLVRAVAEVPQGELSRPGGVRPPVQ